MAETVSFADHHPFGEAEAASLLAAARRANAGLVTTEKDWARMSGGGAVAELRKASRTLPIRLHLEARDGLRLASLLDGMLKRRDDATPRASAATRPNTPDA